MTSLASHVAIFLVFSAGIRCIGGSSSSTNELPQCKLVKPGGKPPDVERQRARSKYDILFERNTFEVIDSESGFHYRRQQIKFSLLEVASSLEKRIQLYQHRGPMCSVKYLGCVDYLRIAFFSEERIHANVSAQEMCYMNEIVEHALDTGKIFVAIARSSNCGKVFMYEELPKSLKAKLRKSGGDGLAEDGSCGLCCGIRSGLPCGKETIIGPNGKYSFIEKLALYRVVDPCADSSQKGLDAALGKGGGRSYNLVNTVNSVKRKCQRCSLPVEPFIEPLLATGTTVLASIGFFLFIALGAAVMRSLRFRPRLFKERSLPKGESSVKAGGVSEDVAIFPHMPQLSRMLSVIRILLEHLTLWLPIVVCLAVGFINSPYACNTVIFCLKSINGPAFECTEQYVPKMPFIPQHLVSISQNQPGEEGNGKERKSLQNGITRIVHQVVDYGRTADNEFLVPKIVAPYIHSCAEAMNWEQRWWGIDAGRPIITEIVEAIGLPPDKFMKTFNATFPNYRYNMLRTAIIWKYGGLYADTDVICLRSPEHLLDDNDFSYAMASEEKIEGALFAARPKHPFNEHLFRIMVERAHIPTIFQRAHGMGPEAFQYAIETYPKDMPKVQPASVFSGCSKWGKGDECTLRRRRRRRRVTWQHTCSGGGSDSGGKVVCNCGMLTKVRKDVVREDGIQAMIN
eukprot:jgi/Bigna1/80866/fgenesh1_pg.75_\